MPMNKELLPQLEKLVETGERLTQSFQKDRYGIYKSTVPEAQLRRLVTSAHAIIEHITGENSVYKKQILEESPDDVPLPNNESLIQTITGVLLALRDDVDQGLLISLESRLRASIHDDFLEQASALLDSGYHVAAMVLIGGVLENHLQKMAQAGRIQLPEKGGVSQYNDRLYSSNSYDKTVWRRIQSIADLRNEAAHGKGSAIASADVEDAHTFFQRFIAEHPA